MCSHSEWCRASVATLCWHRNCPSHLPSSTTHPLHCVCIGVLCGPAHTYVHATCNMYTIHMHVYYTLNVHTLYIEWNMYTIHIACNMYTIYITFNIFTLHITYVHNTHAHVHNTHGMHSTHCSDICSLCYVHTSLVWQFMVCTVTTVTTSTQDLPWCNLLLCHWLLQFWTLQLTWPADRMTLVWWYNHCILSTS